MKEKAKKIIDREILKLSQEKQDAINSLNWVEIIEKIGIKNLFNEPEIKDLIIETGLVLAGLVNPNTYALNIENNISTSKDEAEKIVAEVFEKIFIPIADKMSEEPVVENPNNATKIPDSNLKLKHKTLREAVHESNYQTKLYSIGGKHNLSINQIGILDGIITKIIEGEIPSDKFETELKSKIELPDETREKLIFNLNESIFKNIREIMKSQDQQKEKGITSSKEKLDTVIPIPPYVETENNQQVAINKEEIPVPNYKKQDEDKIYNDSGIEIMEESITNGELEITNEDKEEDNKILGDLGVDIIEEKLNKPMVSHNKISDHSLPKVTPQENSNSGDQYREEI